MNRIYLIGEIIEHNDDALVRQNHLAKCWPAGKVHRLRRWNIDVVEDAAVLEGRNVRGWVYAVIIAHQNSDHFKTMGLKPGVHGREVCFKRADVKKVTGRVTESEGVVDDVRFELETSNTIVELVFYA